MNSAAIVVFSIVFLIGVPYCLIKVLPDTYRQIKDIIKSGLIWSDDYE